MLFNQIAKLQINDKIIEYPALYLEFTYKTDENESAILEGFTLLGGRMAIRCISSAPTIRFNLLINQNVDNRGAISLEGHSPAVIYNNTIAKMCVYGDFFFVDGCAHN